MELQRRRLLADHHLHAYRALAAAAAILGWAPLASAQISVEVSPLRVELQTAPGGTTTQAITLTNAAKEPVRVRARLTDWTLSRDGAPQFEGTEEGGPYSATGWVRIAPPEQIIEGGKQGTVRFSLAVPAGVTPAGYRTAVLFEFGPATADPLQRGRQVLLRSRVATLIYVSVGQAPMAGDLTDLQVRTSGTQTQVIATLKNTSRRYVRTKGTLVLYDAAGKAVREVPVPDVPLLPESERDVAIVAYEPDKAPLSAGEYRVEVKIDVGLPELLVGETRLKIPR